MSGPTEQQTVSEVVLPGESREVYGPSSLAWLVENLEVGPDGISTSVVGPSILRIGINAYASSSSAAFEDLNITGPVKSSIDSLLAPHIFCSPTQWWREYVAVSVWVAPISV